MALSVYTNSSLSVWIHGKVPRYDLDLEAVDAKFWPEDAAYREAILLVSVPAVGLALFTLLYLCCRCCCHNLCSSVKSKHSGGPLTHRPHPTMHLVMFGLACVVVVAGNCFGFVSNDKVNSGVGSVKAAMDDMKVIETSALSAADDVVDGLRRVSVEAQDMEEVMVSAASVYYNFSSELEMLRAAKADCDATANTISTVTSPLVDVKFWSNQIDEAEMWRWRGQLAFLALLTLPYVMTLYGIAFKSRKAMFNLALVAPITVFLGFCVSGVEMSATTGLGDLCYDPADYFSNRLASLETSSLTYVRFFVVCVDVVNPMQSSIDDANAAVNSTQTTLDRLRIDLAAADAYISAGNATALNSSLADLIVETDRVAADVVHLVTTALTCDGVHNTYVDAMNGLCGDTLAGFFALIWVQVAMALLTITAVFSASALYKYWQQGKLGASKRWVDNRATSFIFNEDEMMRDGLAGSPRRGGGRGKGGRSAKNEGPQATLSSSDPWTQERIDSTRRKKDKARHVSQARRASHGATADQVL